MDVELHDRNLVLKPTTEEEAEFLRRWHEQAEKHPAATCLDLQPARGPELSITLSASAE